MSETVHYKGKLIPIITVESVQETALRILVNNYIRPTSGYDSFLEQLCEEVDEKYYERNGTLYKAVFDELDPDDDIMEATINPDGSIDFEVKYYNGGGSMDEALDQSITNAGIDAELNSFYSDIDKV